MAEHFLDDRMTHAFWDKSAEPRLEIEPGDLDCLNAHTAERFLMVKTDAYLCDNLTKSCGPTKSVPILIQDHISRQSHRG